MEIDYNKLNLKVGLEIHQQLDTKSKLFCDCRTDLSTPDTPIKEVNRYLKVTKSEVGEVDPAALYEIRKGKRIVYQVPEGHACLVELDEEPPHDLNREALAITLAIAKALHSDIVNEVYVMRKIVVDGSNTTGFQRTAIVAFRGYIEDEEGKIGIQTICLEEDAARKVDEGTGYVKYNLDRLGIPLIEIATSPDIKSPEQAMRVALKIGMLMRLSGKVKRGLGTIRQDLNVSIEGGEKIEIKGVGKLELIPKVIRNEVMRQLKLKEIASELNRRGIKADMVNSEIFDITQLLTGCDSKLVKRALKRGNRAFAILLRGFKGILGIEVQPNRRFGTELSDYAKAWGGVTGIIHSDELPGYGIDERTVDKIFDYIGGDKSRDAFVFVLSDYSRAERALKAVLDRARQALYGIPKETRGANPDGTTRYLRPQPGAARMYPETDVPPVRVDEEILKEAEKYVPKTPEEMLRELIEGHGLSNELANQLIRDPMLPVYLDLVSELSGVTTPSLIASTVVIHLKSIKSEGVDPSTISYEDLKEVLHAAGKGIIAKEAIPEILVKVGKEGRSAKDVLQEYSAIGEDELTNIIRDIIEKNKDVISERGVKAFGLIMGKVMAIVRGRADGKLVAKLVNKLLLDKLKEK